MKRYKILTAVITVVLALSVLTGTAAAVTFPDVPAGQWYTAYIERLAGEGVIDGFEDGSYRPEGVVTRGQFIKLVSAAFGWEPVGDITIDCWAQPWWNTAEMNGALVYSSIRCSKQELEGEISRYEMAHVLRGALEATGDERANVSEPETVITDYAGIPEDCRESVVQVYALGIITGFDDGSFGGEGTLTRAQTAAVIVRLTDKAERKPADFPPGEPETPEEPEPPEDPPEDYTPFAVWAQQNGYINAAGKTTSELRLLLFGDENKSYFATTEEAAPFMTKVEIPLWRLDSKGEKYADTTTVIVNNMVAADVLSIFRMIFDSPERFPIQSVGGARYGDTMRHSWGCAIDINWQQNAYGFYKSGKFVPVTGSGWWPGTNELSITATGSVVAAFAQYGWGWGGQGYSSGYHDYMHFSIMSNGG